MTKISQLISKLEELEHEIKLEEKTILKNAIQELQNKFKNEDPSVLDIQNKLIDKQEKDFSSLNLERDKGTEPHEVLVKPETSIP